MLSSMFLDLYLVILNEKDKIFSFVPSKFLTEIFSKQHSKLQGKEFLKENPHFQSQFTSHDLFFLPFLSPETSQWNLVVFSKKDSLFGAKKRNIPYLYFFNASDADESFTRTQRKLMRYC